MVKKNNFFGGADGTAGINIQGVGEAGQEVFKQLNLVGLQKGFNTMSQSQNILLMIILISLGILIYNYRTQIVDAFKKLFNIEEEVEVVDKNEVFNILDNIYTYDEAEKVCNNVNNSTLATYDQVVQAYDNGAEWCNYGWVKGEHDGLALYPMQSTKDGCGEKGINGGYFDTNLKFGVNCYGIKPSESNNNTNYNVDSVNTIDDKKNSDELQDLIDTKGTNADLMGFNSSSWSMHS